MVWEIIHLKTYSSKTRFNQKKNNSGNTLHSKILNNFVISLDFKEWYECNFWIYPETLEEDDSGSYHKNIFLEKSEVVPLKNMFACNISKGLKQVSKNQRLVPQAVLWAFNQKHSY